MSHKTLVRWAVVMVVIFLVTIIAYPRIFAPHTAMPVESASPAAPSAASHL